MRLIDPSLFEQKKQELLEKFAAPDDSEVSTNENPEDAAKLEKAAFDLVVDLEDAAKLDEAAFDLVVDLFAIQRGLDPTDEPTRAELESSVRQKLAGFDPDDPAATHSAKILRLLADSDQIGAASTYAEALGLHKKREFSKVQTERATGSRPTPYQEFLKSLVCIHPTIDKEEALRRIEQQKGIYPIWDVCEEWIWVYKGEDDPSIDLPEYKRYKISALGSNLSQVKKELKNPRKPT